MKTLLFLLLLLSSLIQADDIPTEPAIIINTKISNVNEYPDTKFIVCYFVPNPALLGYDIYMSDCTKLEENEIIEGFKPHWSEKRLFAIPKSFYESVEMNTTIQTHRLNIETYQNDVLYKKSIAITPVYYMWDNETQYPIDEETRIYKITSVTDNNVTLKLDKRIIHFTNGEDNKTISY